jgi:hypothetical protein
MTTNIELDTKAKELGIKNYVNCRMKDELKGHHAKDDECGIVNMNDSTVDVSTNQETGHWIVVMKDKGKSMYFDSFGSPCPLEVIDYLGKPILTHNFICQPMDSSICGELCLLFLVLYQSGLSYSNVVLALYEMFHA